MRTLDRLLLSDARRKWGQSLSIVAVLGCGVATFVMSTSVYRTLEVSRERYYRAYRFADVFAQLTRAPGAVADRLRDVPGVERVETRVVRPVVVDLPTLDEPISARLVSLPDSPETGLNAVHLRRGRWPDPDRRGEVVLSEPFAEAHRVRPGDELHVVLGGVRQRLRIVGIGLSPEYVYAVQPGQFLPDDRRFGILWIAERRVAAAFNMEGAFNDVSLLLRPRASERDVRYRVDRILEPYGCRGAYGRDEQPSHRRLADEMLQLESMAVVMPFIFLSAAAFLLNLVFSRMVDHEQEQIATLRAFGYSAREIGWHYGQRLVVLVAVAVVLGTMGGVQLARGMATNFANFFRFPVLDHRLAWDGVALATVVSLAAGLLGGATALRRVIALPAAVAMRPSAPKSYRRAFVERIGLGPLLSPIAAMVVRRLERNWRSSALSVLAMSLGVALLVVGAFFEDTIDYVIDAIFEDAQRQDVTLVFDEAVSPRAAYDMRALPGVTDVEGFRSTPVRLHRGNRSKRIGLVGLKRRPRLFRVVDRNERAVEIAEHGLTISEKLGELLAVSPGDEVRVEFLEGGIEDRRVIISRVFPNYTDPVAYTNRRDLHRLLGEGERWSGAYLAVDLAAVGDLYREVKRTPAVAGITVKASALETFERTVTEHLRRMRTSNAMFATVIAFGVMLSCSLITLSERSRDLATFRVLGFTRAEVAGVLLGEVAAITLMALPVGLVLGYGLSWSTTVLMDTETQRWPMVISRATFAYAAAMTLAAAAVSSLVVTRLVSRLDLIAVLKVRE